MNQIHPDLDDDLTRPTCSTLGGQGIAFRHELMRMVNPATHVCLAACPPALPAIEQSTTCNSRTGTRRDWSSSGVLHRGGVAPPERLTVHAAQGRLFQPRCRVGAPPEFGGWDNPANRGTTCHGRTWWPAGPRAFRVPGRVVAKVLRSKRLPTPSP